MTNRSAILELLDDAHPLTLAGNLAAGATGRLDELALIVDDDRRTYGELLTGAARVANALIRLDVDPGMAVAVLGANSVHYAEALFGIAMAGAVVVPLSHRSTAEELTHQLGLTDAAVLLVVGAGWREDGDAAQRVADLNEVGGDLTGLRHVAWVDETGAAGHPTVPQLAPDLDTSSLQAIGQRARAVGPDQVGAMMFTSGTESRPKAVMHRGDRMVGTALARWVQALAHEPGDRVWIPTPMCHTAAMLFLIGALGRGLTFVTANWFDAETAVRLIDRHECVTLWPQFPAILQALEDAKAEHGAQLTSARQVAVVGTRAAFEQGARLFPNATIFTGYGSTELNAFISCPDLSSTPEALMATAGRPFDGIEVAIADPATGELLPDGAEGEIVVRGSCLFVGYFRDEVATAAVMDDDGWFHTGDLGVRRPDGSYMWSGRKKELLKVGGTNMAPAEVEAVVHTLPGVRQVAVVGIPDPRLDEVPVAFVERDPAVELAEDDVLQACRAALSSFKVPRRVWWIEPGEWPMSLTKVNKVVLRERATAMAEAEAMA